MSETFSINRGDSAPLTVIFKNAEGEAVDLTSYAVFFTAKKNLKDDDASAVISKKITNHIAAQEGKTIIDLTAAETDDIEPGTYYWDLQLVSGTSIMSTQYGTMEVKPDVTRRTS